MRATSYHTISGAIVFNEGRATAPNLLHSPRLFAEIIYNLKWCKICNCSITTRRGTPRQSGYQQQCTSADKERLQHRFDEIFGLRYPHHYGLNLAMQQFCANTKKLLRVLDAPQLPLHTNCDVSDIREYVTKRKISGVTRHEFGRLVRDTFTGLKKTCRKLGFSFGKYLFFRFKGDESVPYFLDMIRTLAPAPT